jgi:hypothetical protein
MYPLLQYYLVLHPQQLFNRKENRLDKNRDSCTDNILPMWGKKGMSSYLHGDRLLFYIPFYSDFRHLCPSSFDFLDHYLRIGLAMALFFPIIILGLIFKNDDLPTLAM